MTRFLSIIAFLFILLGFSFVQNQRHVDAEKVYISTDRYYYKPGEKVLFSAFISNTETKMILSSKVKVWLENNRHQIIDSLVLLTTKKSIEGQFKLPQTGGIYYLKSLTAHQMNYAKQQVFSKEIFVQSYVKQNVNVRIELDKKNYESKDSVKGVISINEPGNKPITQTPVKYNLIQDGEVVYTQTVKSDLKGKVQIKMRLPEFMDTSRFYMTAEMHYRASKYSASSKIVTQKREAMVYLHYGHGSKGYIPNKENRIILKSTDKNGNPMDIKAELIGSVNFKKVPFRSTKNGLGAMSFVPKPDTRYFLVRDKDTLMELEKSQMPVGMKCTHGKGKFEAELIGDVSGKDLIWTATYNGEVLINQQVNEFSKYALNTQGMTGVLSMQVADRFGPLAQKVFFLGREQMKSAQIDMSDSVFMKGKLKEVRVKHPEGKNAHFSISIIEESNINQIEDKSHNVASWLYLGSEFKTVIDEPQFYFDNKKVLSQKTLELLMHTLTPYWIRDYNTGKIIGNPNFEFTSNTSFGGNIRCASSFDNGNCNHVSVSIKNTSIQTFTDETGNFNLTIPPYYQGEVTLIIKKNLEKIEYKINNLNEVINLNDGFYQVKELPQDTMPIFAALDEKVRVPEGRNEIEAKVIAKKKNLALFVRRDIQQIGNKALIELDIQQNRMAGVNAINGVRIAGGASFTFMDNAYAMSPELNANVLWYNWDYGNIGTYSVGQTGKSYQQPFYVYVRRNRVRNIPHPLKNESTAFWKAFIETNTKGKALIKLAGQLAAGGFLILIEGIDDDGRPFWAKKYVEVKDQFAVETNIPDQLYVGDKAIVDVSITNNQKKGDKIAVKSTIYGETKVDSLYVPSNQTVMHSISLGSPTQIGSMPVSINLSSGSFQWNTSKNVNIDNYHIRETEVIGGDSTNEKNIDLSNAELSSVSMQMEIFPNLSQQVMKIAQNLIRQPSGCFEQVSSSNYPNIMALMLMQKQNNKDQKVQLRAERYIQDGYKKLVSYETPQSGFEWFGNNPPHEALTAYGLLQFSLMKKVGLKINEKMFNRNLNWLWNRRDNQGGFKFHKGKYDRFSRGNYKVNNAYITYVLARVSAKDINPQIEAIKKDLKQDFDGYKMALLVNILQKRGQLSLANEYYKTLKRHITKSVFKELDTKQSIVCNRGQPLDIEVLAITLMAAVESNDLAFASKLRSTILASTNGRGYFGSTQATALSLEALTLLSAKETESEKSVYQIFINGTLAKTISLGEKNPRLKTDIASNLIRSGKNKIQVKTNGKAMAYNYRVTWVEKRQSKIHKKLPFEVSYSKNSLNVSDFCQMKVFIKNNSRIELGQVVASINIPSALNPSTEELRQLTRLREISYYELIGNKLNLYFLGFSAGQSRTLSLNLKANLKGVYHSASHEVFEYYQPQVVSKFISNPITIQ